ncbi:MAG: hypothetical protein Q8O09_05275 [Bacillota bacterium]|nr:hypothetical protein [Bacillota bacterium]
MSIFKNGKSKWAAIGIIAAAVIALGLGGYAFYSAATQSSASYHAGAASAKLRVEVVDGMTEVPLEGAVVVVPETNSSYATDKDGKTAVIEVPYMPNHHFDAFMPQPWGEVTLVIYKEDYVTYCLFHCQVMPGQTRMGPKILLFETKQLSNTQPFSIIEGPNRVWLDELVKKYQPK